ncbi:MAG: winged helix-turn-helix domain-containing protein, partial [Rhodocyclaceae bacterium]|nr:winged helix-turn-helix domain-containing protein [Rhodocyclaceae bacterium]
REVRPHEDYENLPDPALKAHLAFSIFSGLFITDPAHPDLDLWEARTHEVLRAFPEPFLTTRSAIMLAQHAFLAGRYRRLAEIRAALDARPALVDPPPYALYLGYAVRLYDDLLRFDHEALAATFDASRTCGEETGAWIMDGHYALDHASGMILRSDLAGAEAVLERVAAVTPPAHYNLAGHLHMIRAWAAACAGDVVRVRAHAVLLRRAADGFGCVGYRVAAAIAETIAVVLDDREDPWPRLAELRRLAAEYRYPLPAIHAGLLEAWLARQAGDGERCRRWLAETLPIFAGESGGYLTFAVPSLLGPLCADALENGIETDFVLGLVRKYALPPPASAGDTWPWPVVVRCFGGFELRVDGGPLPARGKSKHRQLDLLRLLASHAPTPLTVARVAEALWPDSEGDAAHHALETTLSRLRSTLPPGLVRLEHGLLGLDPATCWSDTAELARLLPDLEAAAGDRLAGLVRRVLTLYRGELLAGHDTAWILAEREAWRGRIARQVGDAARRMAEAGRPEPAAELLRWALDTDPHN